MRTIGDTVGASPLIDRDTITFSVETNSLNGYLVRLNKKNGDIIWMSPPLGEQAHSSPALDVPSGTLVLGVNNSTIQGFSYSSGRRLWSIGVNGPVKSTPVVDGGIGYVTTWGKELIAFNMDKGIILWKFQEN